MSYGKPKPQGFNVRILVLGLTLLVLGGGYLWLRPWLATSSGFHPELPVAIAQSHPMTELGPQQLPITAQAQIGSQTVDLEVAHTVEEQAIGLMYRPDLPPNQGMLFPFQPPRSVSFWMKNCLIPLDMIFLHQGRVVAIAEAKPCDREPCPLYPSGQPIDQVIEVRGGRAAELGLQVGDSVPVKFLAP